MLRLSAIIVLTYFSFTGSLNANEIVPFEKIMKLMTAGDITYERIGYYERPFKVIKKSDGWILSQMQNFKQSSIKDEGDNKISVNDFPHNWTVNGTWTFKKVDAKCRIDHKNGGMVMRWNCGS